MREGHKDYRSGCPRWMKGEGRKFSLCESDEGERNNFLSEMTGIGGGVVLSH